MAEYDPKDVIPQYVPTTRPPVPKSIQDELPTHDGGQFGEIQDRTQYYKAQPASALLHENLYLINRGRQIKLSPFKNPPDSLAKQAVKGSKAAQVAQPTIDRKRFLDRLKDT